MATFSVIPSPHLISVSHGRVVLSSRATSLASRRLGVVLHPRRPIYYHISVDRCIVPSSRVVPQAMDIILLLSGRSSDTSGPAAFVVGGGETGFRPLSARLDRQRHHHHDDVAL